MDDEQPLRMEMVWSIGEGHLEVGPDHLLAAPFRQAMVAGKPPGRAVFLVCTERDPPSNRVVGAFVHTPGNRLVFFPGAALILAEDDGSGQFVGRQLEHLTLDPPKSKDRHPTHIVVSGSGKAETHGYGYTTSPPQGYNVPWFSILAPSLQPFPKLPRKLAVVFPALRKDTTKFAYELLRGHGSAFLELPLAKHVNNYLQLDVWAGRGADWEGKKVKPLSWAYKPELVSDPPVGSQKVDVNQLEAISFLPDAGIRVLALRPKGKVRGLHILRARLSR